ncbi:hypothetical protein B0W47_10320 [Komagataeibacter nataicola]|uniref:Uncharacterized protein n=1 Tax=Komagataeibacter nataicola TaxID=265960 RepID=A0A9N7H2H1_9PROT|nr:hypothetical protein [Komagataeibacter nataicola]AQU87810.1 hypothetical protein B0W47_10320 [Komagataeibacter nataicola]PYD66204.1 hypothetical protein CDI09_09370 [Komagataeibacter nataicola]WNM09592.1 hypothetical protein RI056_06595 [Komagataeibacter nataicola]
MSRPARIWSARALRRIEHLRKEGLSWREVGEAMGSSSASCHRAWRAHTAPPSLATPDRLAVIQAATTEISVMAGILARMAEGDKQTGTELAWLADGIGRYAHAIEDCIS